MKAASLISVIKNKNHSLQLFLDCRHTLVLRAGFFFCCMSEMKRSFPALFKTNASVLFRAGRFLVNAKKKANMVPFHKKGDKQILKDYRPVLLLPFY